MEIRHCREGVPVPSESSGPPILLANIALVPKVAQLHTCAAHGCHARVAVPESQSRSAGKPESQCRKGEAVCRTGRGAADNVLPACTSVVVAF